MDKSLKKYLEKIEKSQEDKKNYRGSHCCIVMDYRLDKSDCENVSPIMYISKFREYYLKSLLGHGGGDIYFCPECGSKLPKGLRDEWFDILENEYGLDDPGWSEQEAKIPAEFKTDEWWKNRGL